MSDERPTYGTVHRMVYNIQLGCYQCMDCDLRLDGPDNGTCICNREHRAQYQQLYPAWGRSEKPA